MPSNRPLAVSLIAILSILGGALAIILSLCNFFTPAPGITSVAPILIGLLWLALGVANMAVGGGLWVLQSWARMGAIVLHALLFILFLFLGALFLFGINLSALDPFTGVFGTVSLPGVGIGFWIIAAISGAIVWYMFTPEAEQALAAGELARPYPRPDPYPPSVPEPRPAPLPPTQQMSSMPAPTRRQEAPLPGTQVMGQKPPAQAWLVVRSGSRAGKQLGLSTSSRSRIGRDATACDLVLDDPAISGQHARIQFERGQFVIYDLASSNGTWVNKRRVQRQPLIDNDEIRVGDTQLVFKTLSRR